MKRVRVKPKARHVPPEHRGEEAEVVAERELAFGRRWLRLRFADGCECWAPEGRVEAQGTLEALEPAGEEGE